MLTPTEADMAMKFLARVDLKGNEAPALSHILSKLNAIKTEKPKDPPDLTSIQGSKGQHREGGED